MKTCGRCKQNKQLSEFNKKRNSKDGRQAICRVCSNKLSKEHYKNDPETHKKRVAKNNKKTIKNNRRKLLDILQDSKCTDCGNKNVLVLEFDHVRGTKKGHISDFVRLAYSWNTILKEMAKCEIVCANCHRIRTYTEFGSHRLDAIE